MRRRLFINGRFFGNKMTAVNRVAWNLTNALSHKSRNWDVVLALPSDLRNVSVPAHWNVRTVGARSGIAWEQSDLPKLSREGVIAGFFNTVPILGRGYVSMLHDAHVFTTPRSYGTATRLWRQYLSRRAGRPGNFVLTVSEHSKQALLERRIGSPDRIGVVHNGGGSIGEVNPDDTILALLKLSEDQPFCIALATLLPHKNIPVLLRAFEDPRLRNMKLILFGSTDSNAFEGAGHMVPRNVTFAGSVSDAELAALYRKALAACMPSTQEGFGLPALESMAVGTPVIFAPCGALPEVVGDTGLSVDPNDATGWSDAIVTLRTDAALRARLSKSAQERAATFNWNKAAKTTLDHLDRWFPA